MEQNQIQSRTIPEEPATSLLRGANDADYRASAALYAFDALVLPRTGGTKIGFHDLVQGGVHILHTETLRYTLEPSP